MGIKENLLHDIENIIKKYDNMLWILEHKRSNFDFDYHSGKQWCENANRKFLCIGTQEELLKLVTLIYLNGSYKIKKFTIDDIYNINDLIVAEDEYRKNFTPKQAGDVVMYNKNEYIVTGFSSDGIWLKKNDKTLFIEDISKVKLIESCYWKYNKK